MMAGPDSGLPTAGRDRRQPAATSIVLPVEEGASKNISPEEDLQHLAAHRSGLSRRKIRVAALSEESQDLWPENEDVLTGHRRELAPKVSQRKDVSTRATDDLPWDGGSLPVVRPTSYASRHTSDRLGAPANFFDGGSLARQQVHCRRLVRRGGRHTALSGQSALPRSLS